MFCNYFKVWNIFHAVCRTLASANPSKVKQLLNNLSKFDIQFPNFFKGMIFKKKFNKHFLCKYKNISKFKRETILSLQILTLVLIPKLKFLII